MNGKILMILICTMALLIGIGAACAEQFDSADDAVALDQDEVAVAPEGDAVAQENETVEIECDEVAVADIVADDSEDLVNESDEIAIEDAPAADEDEVQDVDDEIVADEEASNALSVVDDVEVVSGDDSPAIGIAGENNVISTSAFKDIKPTKSLYQYVGYGSKYKTFKGKSHYKWKIKRSKWKKMKKQAKKSYRFFRSHGSYHPGYSNGVKVTVKIGGYKYRLTAYAVKTYKGIKCELRGLGSYRLSTWGDYYIG